jgi:hypothetical protein
MSMKNSNDTTWNRTRDLPACGAVPQPTAPQRVRYKCNVVYKNIDEHCDTLGLHVNRNANMEGSFCHLKTTLLENIFFHSLLQEDYLLFVSSSD